MPCEWHVRRRVVAQEKRARLAWRSFGPHAVLFHTTTTTNNNNNPFAA